MTKGLEFDPGFGPHVLALQGSIEYLYNDINKFKNLSQRKMRFRQYYKKILDIFYNNIGFYIGCLMWASYTKTQDEQEILNNHCYGQNFDEKDNTAEPDFMLSFIELFPKDMKYFLGENFEFEPYVKKVVERYKEFLELNRGFVDTKTNTDIKLPSKIKTDDALSYKDKVEKVIKSGDLSKLVEYKDII